jgi:hypothetical protein
MERKIKMTRQVDKKEFQRALKDLNSILDMFDNDAKSVLDVIKKDVGIEREPNLTKRNIAMKDILIDRLNLVHEYANVILAYMEQEKKARKERGR